MFTTGQWIWLKSGEYDDQYAEFKDKIFSRGGRGRKFSALFLSAGQTLKKR